MGFPHPVVHSANGPGLGQVMVQRLELHLDGHSIVGCRCHSQPFNLLHYKAGSRDLILPEEMGLWFKP